ncbi:unnamed protein product [Parajaminaea phylloscopi]
MPAIRRPRVDVILRVPKRLPYSEDAAGNGASTSSLTITAHRGSRLADRRQSSDATLPAVAAGSAAAAAAALSSTSSSSSSSAAGPAPSSTGLLPSTSRAGRSDDRSGHSDPVIVLGLGGSEGPRPGAKTPRSSTPQVTLSIAPQDVPDRTTTTDGPSDRGGSGSSKRPPARSRVVGSGVEQADEEGEIAEQPIAKASETSSAEWNSLLIWARRARGPQWDSGLGMWMVDAGSAEYTTFCSDPTQSVFGPPAASEGDEVTTEAEMEAGPATRSRSAAIEAGAPGASQRSPSQPAQQASASRLPPMTSPVQGRAKASNSGAPPPPPLPPSSTSASAHAGQQGAVAGASNSGPPSSQQQTAMGPGNLPPPHFDPGQGFSAANAGSATGLASMSAMAGSASRHASGLPLGARNW